MTEDNFNGPSRELMNTDFLEDAVYCVKCGNIFVPARGRDCPACAIAEELGGEDA